MKPALALSILAAIFLAVAVTTREDNHATLRASRIPVGTAIDPAFLSEPGYAETAARDFSVLEPENAMKWDAIHPENGVYDFTQADKVVDFAEQHGMKVLGCCPVWYSQLPKSKWLGWVSKERMGEELHAHIRAVVGHYRGRVYAWHAVNESFHSDGSLRHSHWYDMPGIGLKGTDYIAQTFEWVHEVDPATKVFYNDFDIEELNPKSDAVYQMVKDFKQRHIHIDGVGMQAHLGLRGLNVESFKANVERFRALGVEVHITELDVAIPRYSLFGSYRQARVYQQVAQAARESGVTLIQVWGFTDRHSWLDGDPTLYDHEYKPKKAYAAMRDVLEGQ